MDVERPDWFERVGEWWDPVVGEGVARRVQPVGVSSDGRLVVLGSSTAYSTAMRLMASRMVERLNTARPDGVPEVTGITVLEPPPIPVSVTQHWADLVGADLAEEVRPDSLADWAQELVTEAESAQARDLLARRAPVVLARLRAVLPETTIVRLAESRLRTVSVLVASSPDFFDRQALEDVLLDTWNDAVQTVGPEHPLRVEHLGETAADKMVEEWGARITSVNPMIPLFVDIFAREASTAQAGPDAVRRRYERLVDREPDLCLVFAAREDEEFPLAELARERGLPVRRFVE
ncbi:DciA family protein [Streptomyces sp. NPDC005538]|uniref:DciA family protein n=1 Tax=Streptomyces sp. NPDC005538 TaxID=3157043 RepID=UPI0033BEF542